MTLPELVTRDIAAAMKARDSARLAPLRMLKTALTNREIERGRALDQAEERQVVSGLIKQRRDSIEQFRLGGRQDLVDRETAEIAVLEAYLPAAADPAEVERVIDATIAETGATSVKDLGRVMKAVMPRLAGFTVEGRVVNELVRRKLSGTTQ
jgi:uncharacterized protein YqeY